MNIPMYPHPFPNEKPPVAPLHFKPLYVDGVPFFCRFCKHDHGSLSFTIDGEECCWPCMRDNHWMHRVQAIQFREGDDGQTPIIQRFNKRFPGLKER